MRRAVDFIDAHLDGAITIDDLAQASGVAGRTLFRHFQTVRGMSPMRYIRERRFQRVRQALLRAEPEESVTEIALKFGFGHLGRFSVQYRERYRETPSQTLRRTARRDQG
jgi:transcriptional regulator GlxA family with amidase domain